MKKAIRYLFILIILTMFIRASHFLYFSLNWPLSYCVDMVLMKFFGWSLDKGFWPYVDIYTYNLPGTVFFNWLGWIFFGNSSVGFRVFDISWLFLTAASIGLYLKRFSKTAGILGFVFTLTLEAQATNFGALQRETILIPFWILSVYLFEKFFSKEWDILPVLSGFFIGLSLMIKPTGAILIFLMGLYAVFALYGRTISGKYPFRLLFRTGGLFISGVLLALLLVTVPFLVKGIFLESITNWMKYFSDLSKSLEIKTFSELTKSLFSLKLRDWTIPLNEPIQITDQQFGSPGHFALFYIPVIIIYFVYALREKMSLFPFFIFLAGLGGYLLQAKGFSYHLFPAWFGIIMMSSVLIGKLYSDIEVSSRSYHSFLTILLLFVFTFSFFSIQSRSHRAYRGSNLYSGFKLQSQEIPLPFAHQKLKDLKEKFKGKVRIQFFEAYHSAALNSVMDLGFDYASPFPEGYVFYSIKPEMDKYKKELMNRMKLQPPHIILMNREGTFEAEKDLFQTFPDLQTFLENYEQVDEFTEINGLNYQLYARK